MPRRRGERGVLERIGMRARTPDPRSESERHAGREVEKLTAGRMINGRADKTPIQDSALSTGGGSANRSAGKASICDRASDRLITSAYFACKSNRDNA